MRAISRTLFAAIVLAAAHASAQQETVLEHYVLGSGGSISAAPGKVSAFIQDESFGGGDARASVFLDTDGDATLLHLRVWRNVPPGSISFALLVFGIEVRGYAADGTEVYGANPRVFSFGDSRSGNWTRRIRMPANVNRVEVRYIGNYE